MKLKIVVALCALFMAPWAQAFQDEPAGQEEDKSMTAFMAIRKTFDDKMAVFGKKYQALESKEERNKLFETDYPKGADYIPKMLKLAEAHPKSKGAYAALKWAISSDQSGKFSATVLPIIARDFAKNDDIGEFCLRLARNGSLAAKDFLRNILTVNNSKEVQGRATFALAKWHVAATKTLGRLNSKDQKAVKRTAKRAGEKTVAFLKETGAKNLEAKALSLFKRVESEFADVPYFRKKTIGTAAKSSVFAMTHLNIGQEAPNITAEDIDGVEFSLSDYRGKVVVLDFWGNW